MELPRRGAGRVFRAHVERAARLLHQSPEDLLSAAGVIDDYRQSLSQPLIASAAVTMLRNRAVLSDTAASSPPKPTSAAAEPAPVKATPARASKPRSGQSSHTAALMAMFAENPRREMDFATMQRNLARTGHSATIEQVRQAARILSNDGHLVRVRSGVYRFDTGLAIQPRSNVIDLRVSAPSSQPPPAAGPVEAGRPTSVELWTTCFPAITVSTPEEIAATMDWIAATEQVLAVINK